MGLLWLPSRTRLLCLSFQNILISYLLHHCPPACPKLPKEGESRLGQLSPLGLHAFIVLSEKGHFALAGLNGWGMQSSQLRSFTAWNVLCVGGGVFIFYFDIGMWKII